jgi:hypothetical protein
LTKHPKIYLGNSLLNINSQDETPFAARTDLKELENPYVFNAPAVLKAEGHQALKILGEPKDVISEMKTRLFAA